MKEEVSRSEYLVISRGQWDKDVSRQENCPRVSESLQISDADTRVS